MSEGQFVGPLFLVGMPRSGTKLLRAMLHQHPRIRFAKIESEFFPYWVTRWQELGAQDGETGFQDFCKNCSRLPFFLQYAERGINVDCAEWYRSCEAYTPAAVFEALIRMVLSISPQDTATIWADKSPSYLRHIPLLIEHFPKARVIHIVRDARDCCLSARGAWGKNMLRVAQRWQDDVSKCREDGAKIGSAYLETRYEDLLSDPKSTVMKISEFVGVDFDERTLSPGADTENLGDAKGVSTVLSSNVNKYQSKMSPKMILEIEKVACATLRDLDYPCSYSGQPVRVPNWQMRLMQFTDAFGLFRSTTSKRGWVGGTKFLLEDFKVSGNRNR